jgi:PAS domain S-box-containing protein
LADEREPAAERGSAARDPYRDLFERSADAILIIDDGAFVDCNKATVEMLRYQEKAQLLRTHPSELSPPFQSDGRDSFTKANEMIAIAFERGSHRFEWDHVRADGEVFPVEVLLTAVMRDGRQILHVVWRDITERKQLEEHLRLAQKMEAIGRMAGGIAHDFNNLLVAIIGNSDALADSLRGDRPRLALLDQIQGAAHRAAALVRDLMAFSRKENSRSKVVDLNSVLRDLRPILLQLLDERFRLEVQLCPEVIRVMVGPGQIEQIVINLVTNARDAMPQGGPVTVELRRLDLSTGDVGVGAELAPGAYAVISVADQGVGMAPEVAAHAFDPFFTTKEVGKGTGLGLATVYAIAKRHGGGADIQSAQGHGTSVRVYLPPTFEEIRSDEARPAAMEDPRGTETILVVEDEPAVAAVVARVLRGAGYLVLLAGDGLEALDVWGNSPVPIDLVITDAVMPRMGGVDLLRRLWAGGYCGAVLLTSGYSNNTVEEAPDIQDAVELLAKPYARSELLSSVRRAFERRGRAATQA